MGLPLAHSAANDTPPPSEDREALRAAIARRDAAVRDMDSMKAARGRAVDMVDAAEKKLEASRAATERAHEQQAENMLEAATSGKPLKTGGAIRAARDAEREALDELEAAKKIEVQLAEKLQFPTSFMGDPTDPVSLAEADVRHAATNVIRDSVPVRALVARANQMLSDLHEARLNLASLFRNDLARPEDRDCILRALTSTHLPSVSSTQGATFYSVEPKTPSPWVTARETLMRDPDASLPE